MKHPVLTASFALLAATAAHHALLASPETEVRQSAAVLALPAAVPAASARAPRVVAGEGVRSELDPSVFDDGDLDAEPIRERIRRNEAGTYINEILLGRDSAITRWPERLDEPLRIWVGSSPRLADWDSTFPGQVRAAFEQWSELDLPVRFAFVDDSADADVHVSWIDHFPTSISGKTLWSRDRHWWIVDANITLAIHHNGGEALDPSAVHAIALHEVGHLLGLDHTADPSNIMTPRVRVRELSSADRATARLIYSVPAGSIK